MKFISFIFFSIINLVAYTQPQPNYNFKHGDFIFQDLNCGSICDAIELVTGKVKGKSYSHLGLVVKENDSLFVLESIGKGVVKTPIQQFLNRSYYSNSYNILVSQLKPKAKKLLPKAIEFINNTLSVYYDEEFIYDNGKYYCSELIYDAFKFANNNKPFFKLYPMTFKIPNTNKYFPVWIEYYEKLQKPIPEGQPGCNPNGIARSKYLKKITQL